MLSQSELKELLQYDPCTGLFARTALSLSKRGVGKKLGAKHPSGYIIIYINYKKYMAHRLAWFYVYGEWPKDQIDHINHKRNDNRIKNLRVVTNKDNGRNTKISSNNTSGVNGVYWDKCANKWRAGIKVNGVFIYLGVFADKFNAICARMSANVKYKFHENHGR